MARMDKKKEAVNRPWKASTIDLCLRSNRPLSHK